MNSFIGIVGALLIFLILGKKVSVDPFWSRILIVTILVVQVAVILLDMYTMESPTP